MGLKSLCKLCGSAMFYDSGSDSCYCENCDTSFNMYTGNGLLKLMKSESEKNCEKCGGEVSHNMKYDAYYCEVCDIWLEPTCDDEYCRFCKTRPDKPSNCLDDSFV